MATSQEPESTIRERLLDHLSETLYKCSSLSQLGTRDGNFVYRGILNEPVKDDTGLAVSNIIVKYISDQADARHRDLEELLLKNLCQLTISSSSSVQGPKLYYYSREHNIEVLHDFSPHTSFFSKILAASKGLDAEAEAELASIGFNLGSWLRNFHDWSSSPKQSALQSKIWHQDSVRRLKYSFTYEVIISVLEQFPDLLTGNQEKLQDILKAAEQENNELPKENNENWGLIHGDLWSGNVLVSDLPPKNSSCQPICVIDWEFTQFGHRCYDLGQILGDLYERHLYNGNKTALVVMNEIIRGYGELNDDMAFRTAAYIGVHVIGWYHRQPEHRRKSIASEVIVCGLKIGIDFILNGWVRDREFFCGAALSSLFKE